MLQYHTALFFGSPSFLSDFSPSVDKAGTNVLRVRSIQAAAESRQSPQKNSCSLFPYLEGHVDFFSCSATFAKLAWHAPR